MDAGLAFGVGFVRLLIRVVIRLRFALRRLLRPLSIIRLATGWCSGSIRRLQSDSGAFLGFGRWEAFEIGV